MRKKAVSMSVPKDDVYRLISNEKEIKSLLPIGNELIALNCGEQVIKVFNLKLKQWVVTLHQGIETPSLAAFPCGKLVIPTGNNELKLWDIEQNKYTDSLLCPNFRIKALAVLDDCTVVIASAGRRGNQALIVWNFEKKTYKRISLEDQRNIYALATLPNGRVIITGRNDCRKNTFKILDVQTQQYTLTVMAKKILSIEAIAVSKDGQYLFSNSYRGAIKQWDLKHQNGEVKEEGECTLMLKRDGGSVKSIAVLPDGKLFISDEKGALEIYDPQQQVSIRKLKEYGRCSILTAALPDGSALSCKNNNEGSITVWPAQVMQVGKPRRKSSADNSPAQMLVQQAKNKYLQYIKTPKPDVPENYCCSIGQGIMLDPVQLPNEPHHSYERDAIVMWLSKKLTSPWTRQRVDAFYTLLEDSELSKEIQTFLKENPKVWDDAYQNPELLAQLKKQIHPEASADSLKILFERAPHLVLVKIDDQSLLAYVSVKGSLAQVTQVLDHLGSLLWGDPYLDDGGERLLCILIKRFSKIPEKVGQLLCRNTDEIQRLLLQSVKKSDSSAKKWGQQCLLFTQGCSEISFKRGRVIIEAFSTKDRLSLVMLPDDRVAICGAGLKEKQLTVRDGRGKREGQLSAVYGGCNNEYISMITACGEDIIMLTRAPHRVDDSLLLWRPEGRQLKLIADLRCNTEFRGSRPNITSIVACPKQKQIISAHPNGSLNLWSIAQQTCEDTLWTKAHSIPTTLAVSCDSESLAVGHENGEIEIWHIGQQKKCVCQFNEIIENITELLFHPDGLLLATNTQGQLFVWNIQEQQRVHTFKAHNAGHTTVKVLPNGHLITAGSDGTIKVWDAKQWKCIEEKRIANKSSAQSIGVFPDGSIILANALDSKETTFTFFKNKMMSNKASYPIENPGITQCLK